MEMLKSILAQRHYHYKIMEWEKKGVPFCPHVYIPEFHPVTGTRFHEREDEAHVFKVCHSKSSTFITLSPLPRTLFW